MSLSDLTIGDITGVLKLKIVSINENGPHRFLDIVDNNKQKASLVFWQTEKYVVDQMVIKKTYVFDKLTVRKKWAPPGREAPGGFQLIFLPANGASVEGIVLEEKSLPKGPPEIKIDGIERFVESLPVLMAQNALEIKPGELKMIATGASLGEKTQANVHFEFKMVPAFIESGLTIPNILVPNVADELFVPVYNPLKKAVKLPKKCHLALLNVILKPRFKFTTNADDDDEENEAVPPTQEQTDGEDSTENEEGSDGESSSEASISVIAPPPVAKKAPRKNSVKRKTETESPKKEKKPKKSN